MMKVLVSDKMDEAGIDIFRGQEGIDVDVNTGLSPEELRAVIGSYDALAIRSATKVDKALLDAADNLKVIARAGIGLDNVDIDEATRKGVAVMNTPGGNTVTTAEHTIAMMMSLTRNIPRATASMKAGKWEKKLLQGREIFNKTLGLIGFGNIGSIVATLAKGLRMRVVVFDPNISSDHIEKQGFEYVDLDTLYSQADYITVHVPKMDATIDLLDAEAFEKMKPGVYVINCARGASSMNQPCMMPSCRERWRVRPWMCFPPNPPETSLCWPWTRWWPRRISGRPPRRPRPMWRWRPPTRSLPICSLTR
jgi:D-3-phosphoglycerate dehydrogenase / 2-oxoglutarate reductase